ncbi:GNAT family N-acetyltransferase [Actinoplanes flavus]|uniref:GNAT family N-acetyltransferase n=1 Tax=Actinoplanes flavus TaxID=2820290 RepID=A0ABS3UIH6_9ACTN|nr:GNAT family N-acetyltransferase [Actinoplanes flavus]MBO3737538.1 GNAT family N-acetyltransferase [Actinoplanes flavus]
MTTQPQPAICTAPSADPRTISELLAEAFLHGDLADWLIPHLDTRARICPRYFALHVEHAITHGQIDMTTDAAAVSIWYPIAGEPLPELPDYSQRLAEAVGRFRPRVAALDQAMNDHQPYGQPHFYLAFLAVHPNRQRRGDGSALLCHRHDQLDGTRTEAYLGATGPRNRRLYARHGYLPQPAFHLPGGPRLYPMRRPSTGE